MRVLRTCTVTKIIIMRYSSYDLFFLLKKRKKILKIKNLKQMKDESAVLRQCFSVFHFFSSSLHPSYIVPKKNEVKLDIKIRQFIFLNLNTSPILHRVHNVHLISLFFFSLQQWELRRKITFARVKIRPQLNSKMRMVRTWFIFLKK